MRYSVLLLLAACGRFEFEDTPDKPVDAADPDAGPVLLVRYGMDDDPTDGTITAEPSEFSIKCAPCPTRVPGRIGTAYHFDGTVRVPLATSAMITSATPFTIAFWVRSDGVLNGLMSPVSKPVDTSTVRNVVSFTIDNTSPGFGMVAYETSLGPNILSFSAPQNILGAWHHVAGRWDGTTRSLFVDGGLTGSDATTFNDSSLAMAMGADLDGGIPAIFYIGDLDELRFYPRALADAELAALANP